MPTDQKQSVMDAPLAEEPQAKVERLLAGGKAKQAVELAKEHHKRCKTPQSEQLLVRAYIARIEQFHQKNMIEEAQALLQLVTERFPAHRPQLVALQMRGAAAEGRIGDLVAPLANPAMTPEQRQPIEEMLRRQLLDPAQLAAAATLPADHPLRTSAAAVAESFAAVTSRLVSDEEIALPMVSRRSPLAAWKLLIRAIAAFYRHDDDGCRRALDAIDADSAVSPLAAALRAMVDGKPSQGGAAVSLAARVVSNGAALRKALASVDQACQEISVIRLERGIRDAIRQCKLVRPELLPRLKQRISVTCYMNDAPIESVQEAMGACLRDSFFWKLLALAAQTTGESVHAAIYWERFCRHAVAEGAFTNSSVEAALIWQHLAQLVARSQRHIVERTSRAFIQDGAINAYYREQPPEIAALCPASDAELIERVLDADAAFAESIGRHPLRQTFAQWLAYAEKINKAAKYREDIAFKWHAARPGDLEPVIALIQSAERRNALTLALKRLALAEAIDPGNLLVRRARARLTLARTWLHFSQNQAHLAETDLRDLAALPEFRDGDGAAMLSFMSAILRGMQGDSAGAAERMEAGIRHLGPLVGPVAFAAVLRETNHLDFDAGLTPPIPRDPAPAEAARADAAIRRLADEMQFRIDRPAEWDHPIAKALREPACPLSATEVRQVGESAIARRSYEIAYLASSVGLAHATLPADSARFLLLRAQSLMEPWGLARADQCLRAAFELSKLAHDESLHQRIIDEMAQCGSSSWNPFPWGQSRYEAIDVNAVLKQERQAVKPPKNPKEAAAYLVERQTNDTAGLPFDIEIVPPDSDDIFGMSDDEDEDEDDVFEEDDDGPGLFGSVQEYDDIRAILEHILAAKGLSIDQIMSDPRKLLEVLADPNLGISDAELQNMRAGLKNFMPDVRSGSPRPGKRGSRRKKRRR